MIVVFLRFLIFLAIALFALFHFYKFVERTFVKSEKADELEIAKLKIETTLKRGKALDDINKNKLETELDKIKKRLELARKIK